MEDKTKGKVPTPDTSPDQQETPSDLVQPLETFQTDIDKYVRENNVSPRELAAVLKNRPSAPAPTPKTPNELPPPPAPIDPRSVVLPSKVIHSPLNATRVNAGELVAGESSATLPKVSAPPRPLPKKRMGETPAVETYQGDIQNYVREGRVSPVTVAAAQERQRDEANEPIAIARVRTFGTKLAMSIGGGVLIIASFGALGYVYLVQRALPAGQAPQTPFIAVDDTTPVPLASSARSDMMQTLVSAKNNTKISLGLVAELVPITATSGNAQINAQDFLSMLTPNIPPQLLRTLQPNFLLGVHSFDVNQPFIILQTDSYEGAYAGMLAWEKTIQPDLAPLFSYTPSPIQTPPSAQPLDTSTQTSSTTSATPFTSAPAVIQSTFVDTILQNHDTRAVENNLGQIELLWTFLDRSTILITTNQDTLKEVISRLRASPTITIPQ